MADVLPFRGLRYAAADLSPLLAGPYDVISPAERARLASVDQHNSVRLILPEPSDPAQPDSRYLDAAHTLRTWLSSAVLVRDEEPALYRYHQVFTSDEVAGGQPIVRRGFVGAVLLRDYDDGIIKPHERTLRGPKRDRLELMTATGAHLSQIFTLYSDPERAVDRIFEPFEKAPPLAEGTTPDGTLHRLWRVTDARAIDSVASLLEPRSLYIADGHHRYETMLALRDRLFDEPQAAFGTLFLANIDDPGLVVLPIHRLVHSLADFDAAALVERAGAAFETERVTAGARTAAGLRELVAERGRDRAAFAMVLPGSDDATVFAARPEARPGGHPAVATLDVSFLHELVLDRLLGIDAAALEAQSHVTYVKSTEAALAALAKPSGDGDPTPQAGFFLNPTPVEQVVAVADAGQTMPQKSTFFYPKIASGVLFRTVRD